MSEIGRLRMVRGGSGRSDTILKPALVLYMECGRAGVSIFAADLGDADLSARAKASLPHPVIRFGWVQCLLDAGFVVEKTGQPLHYTVWFPDVHAGTISAFSACFESAVTNPHARS